MSTWEDEAECRRRKIPVSVFFPDPEADDFAEKVEQAKDVCRECPVRADCFLAGMANEEQGVWGGTHLDFDPDQ